MNISDLLNHSSSSSTSEGSSSITSSNMARVKYVPTAAAGSRHFKSSRAKAVSHPQPISRPKAITPAELIPSVETNVSSGRGPAPVTFTMFDLATAAGSFSTSSLTQAAAVNMPSGSSRAAATPNAHDYNNASLHSANSPGRATAYSTRSSSDRTAVTTAAIATTTAERSADRSRTSKLLRARRASKRVKTTGGLETMMPSTVTKRTRNSNSGRTKPKSVPIKPKPKKLVVFAPRTASSSKVHYPAFNLQDQEQSLGPVLFNKLQAKYAEFQIVPCAPGKAGDRIGDFQAFIPFNGLSSTAPLAMIGRPGFQSCGYTYIPTFGPQKNMKLPLQWDEEFGLVHISFIIQALGYKKGDPRKFVEEMGGFNDLLIRTTGGVTGTQGFWLPFDIARELLRAYCWRIRWVLVPVFGPDFLDECIPEGADGFATPPKIDQAIIDSWVQKYADSRAGVSTDVEAPEPSSSPSSPVTLSSNGINFTVPSYSDDSGSLDEDDDDDYVNQSPRMSPKSTNPPCASVWTPINSSPAPIPRSVPHSAPAPAKKASKRLITGAEERPKKQARTVPVATHTTDVEEAAQGLVKMAHGKEGPEMEREVSVETEYLSDD